MKLLCLCSALDLQFRYGCTPAWWQFFKGLYELGHDVIAVPYQGAAIESPWWRVYPNPCQHEGAAFAKVKSLLAGAGPMPMEQGIGAQVTKGLIDNWIRPRWRDRIDEVLRREKDVDAVIVFTIPVNHFTGIPNHIRKLRSIPVVYYDGDVPASLPEFGGFASGFKIYEGADLSEYDGVLCNSTGGAARLTELGARTVSTVHWGVDPELYAPIDIPEDRDVYFYGFGAEYREAWIRAMMVDAAEALPEASFAIGGKNFAMPLGRVHMDGDVPFNTFRQACRRSKINLNITRDAHASVYASSSMRIFELAAMGCCVVTNPVAGLEEWFTPGEHMAVAGSGEEAVALYRELLADESRRRAMGDAARAVVLERHTHRHRAQEIVDFLDTLASSEL